MARAERAQERSVALVEEQYALDVIRLAEVGGQSGAECADVRMEKAKRPGPTPFPVHFGDLPHAGQIRPDDVFDRAEQFQTALLRGGQHGGDDVKRAVVRSVYRFQDSVLIKVWMRAGVITAPESFLVGLPGTMVGKRLPGNLSPAPSAAVGE